MPSTAKLTPLQQELTWYLDENVIDYSVRRLEHDGWTYKRLAEDLGESGFKINVATLASWVSIERKRKSFERKRKS